MRSRMYYSGWKVLDWFFPPTCAGCGKWGKRYCEDCLSKTRLITKPICQICGDLLEDESRVTCFRCQNNDVAYTAVRSWAQFAEPLQSAIHQLKYHQDVGLAGNQAQHLSELLTNIGWSIDLITAIPLGQTRQKERGYNQAALLARPISWEIGIKFEPGAVVRCRNTLKQTGLNSTERQANMAGAFQAQRSMVLGKTILIVDDVITTGATMNACAQALMVSGARKVYGITLARSAHL
ncbi:MAG: ComF family protein [Anaerolineales bacterium]